MTPRIIVTVAILLSLTGLSVGFTPLSEQQAVAQSANPLTLFPIEIDLGAPEDGWIEVTVTFGVRNEGTEPKRSGLSASADSKIAIEEGRTYDANLDLIHVSNPNGGSNLGLNRNSIVSQVAIPPGFVLCGQVVRIEAGDYRMGARAKIPEGTTASALIIPGFQDVDLTQAPEPEACAVDNSQISAQIPTELELMGTKSETSRARLRFTELTTMSESHSRELSGYEGDEALIHADLENLDRFDAFGFGIDRPIDGIYEFGEISSAMTMWGFDEEAMVVVQPHHLDCEFISNETAGPGKKVHLEFCLFVRKDELEYFILEDIGTDEQTGDAINMGIYELIRVQASSNE